jgi:anti-sigma factor RsiW
MISRDELNSMLPDLVDGNVPAERRAEAEQALAHYPDVQRDLEIARQIRTLLVSLQTERPELRLPAGFEMRLLTRIKQENSRFDALDLSCTVFAEWLVEFINLVGGLVASLAPLPPSPAPPV